MIKIKNTHLFSMVKFIILVRNNMNNTKIKHRSKNIKIKITMTLREEKIIIPDSIK
jgi:hypothetical protein